MPMGWSPACIPNPVTAPERVSEAGILLQRALSVLPQNVRGTAVFVLVLAQMLTHPGRGEGFAPGFGVRVMGWCGGEEGEGYGYRITLWSAGALPGKILRLRPGACCFVPARIRETVRRFSVLLAQPV